MKLIATLGIVTTFALVFSCGSDDSGGGSGGNSSDASTGGGGSGGSATGGSGGSATGGSSGSGTGGGSGGNTGGVSGSGTGGAAGNGPGDGGGDVCFPCILSKCQSGIDDCNADTDCKAIFDCVSAPTCQPPDCSLETCLADNPGGGATFNSTVIACAKSMCAADCNFN